MWKLVEWVKFKVQGQQPWAKIPGLLPHQLHEGGLVS